MQTARGAFRRTILPIVFMQAEKNWMCDAIYNSWKLNYFIEYVNKFYYTKTASEFLAFSTI